MCLWLSRITYDKWCNVSFKLIFSLLSFLYVLHKIHMFKGPMIGFWLKIAILCYLRWIHKNTEKQSLGIIPNMVTLPIVTLEMDLFWYWERYMDLEVGLEIYGYRGRTIGLPLNPYISPSIRIDPFLKWQLEALPYLE